jgi:hypothetical protein
MKVREVVLRAIAKKITWWQAAEILGLSGRQLRRLRQRYEEHGYDGLMDRRRGKPSARRVPLATVETVLGLYRGRYFDLNVAHSTRSWRGSTRSASATPGSSRRCRARGWWPASRSAACTASGASGVRCRA